jgi:hypothetical protein
LAGNRGFANQALYEARILLDCWLAAEERGQWPAPVVCRAFRLAVLLHLRRGYGWFLLAVAGLDDQPDPRSLPLGAEAVPMPPAGRSPAPELREFALLEQSGWLREMLCWEEEASASPASAVPLLGSDRAAPGRAVIDGWHRELVATMARMDDSLSEC